MKSGQKFTDWIKARIEKYDFVENIDFVTLPKKVERQILIEYFVSIDMAKELSMVENNEQGKIARRYSNNYSTFLQTIFRHGAV